WFGGNASRDLGREVVAARGAPDVVQAWRFTNGIVSISGPRGPVSRSPVLAWVGIDHGWLNAIGRPLVIAGRTPNDDVTDAVAIDEELARDAHLRVGSTMSLRAYT